SPAFHHPLSSSIGGRMPWRLKWALYLGFALAFGFLGRRDAVQSAQAQYNAPSPTSPAPASPSSPNPASPASTAPAVGFPSPSTQVNPPLAAPPRATPAPLSHPPSPGLARACRGLSLTQPLAGRGLPQPLHPPSARLPAPRHAVPPARRRRAFALTPFYTPD